MVVGKAPQINGKLKKKVSSSYHMDYKIFIEASYNNNIHTGEKVFFEGLRAFFFLEIVKNCGTLWSVMSLFTFLENRGPSKYCL